MTINNNLKNQNIYQKKFLYSVDEKILIKNIYSQNKDLKIEDIEHLTLHIKKYILDALNQDKKIEIRNFGSFFLRKRRLPKSDKQYRFLYFKPSKTLP